MKCVLFGFTYQLYCPTNPVLSEVVYWSLFISFPVLSIDASHLTGRQLDKYSSS
jgi:hypothetical protein